MNHSLIAQKYSSDPDDRLLISRALDLAKRADLRGGYEFTDFLTPAQRGLLSGVQELRQICSLSFDGGYAEAERSVAILCSYGIEYTVPAPIVALELVTKGEPLGHRDILGALMALGIKREKLGDIIAAAEPPIFLCSDVIAPYIIDHFDRAGRNSVSIRYGTLDSIPAPKTVEKSASVMSLRLDSVVAEGFGMSRTKAAELVRSGVVSLNWQVCESPAKSIDAGDRISAKGFGKFCIAEVGGQSRKGRTFIKIEKYI